MSDRRQVWATLSELLGRLEEGLEGAPQRDGDDLEPLVSEVRRLGKTQYRANALVEEQGARLDTLISNLEATSRERAALMDETVAEQVAQARREWASSLLPALDGLERAIASGGRFLSSQEPNDGGGALPTEQLTNWLEGLEFVRQRLLAVLEEGGVVPIEALGRRFDPHLHVAVDTAAEGADEPGTIVEEERRGYRLGEEVLRYAEVVVYRSQAERDGAK